MGNPGAWLGVPAASGVFSNPSDGGATQQANQDCSGYSERIYVYFNANYYNPIYGNSQTVQSPSLVFNYIVKY